MFPLCVPIVSGISSDGIRRRLVSCFKSLRTAQYCGLFVSTWISRVLPSRFLVYVYLGAFVLVT